MPYAEPVTFMSRFLPAITGSSPMKRQAEERERRDHDAGSGRRARLPAPRGTRRARAADLARCVGIRPRDAHHQQRRDGEQVREAVDREHAPGVHRRDDEAADDRADHARQVQLHRLQRHRARPGPPCRRVGACTADIVGAEQRVADADAEHAEEQRRVRRVCPAPRSPPARTTAPSARPGRRRAACGGRSSRPASRRRARARAADRAARSRAAPRIPTNASA